MNFNVNINTTNIYPWPADLGSTRRHQTCHFRKRATSAPAEGPAHGPDFARHYGQASY